MARSNFEYDNTFIDNEVRPYSGEDSSWYRHYNRNDVGIYYDLSGDRIDAKYISDGYGDSRIKYDPYRYTTPWQSAQIPISDIVENIARVGDNKDIYQACVGRINRFAGNDGNSQEAQFTEMNGWAIQLDEIVVGRKRRFIAVQFTSENMTVYVLNTCSTLSNIRDYCVFSQDKKAVESFLQDFDIKAEIIDMDSVCVMK